MIVISSLIRYKNGTRRIYDKTYEEALASRNAEREVPTPTVPILPARE